MLGWSGWISLLLGDLRTEPRMFSTRQKGGESLMFWGAIFFYEQSELVFVDVNLNSEKYCFILAAHLLSMAAETFRETQVWIF